MQLILRKKNWLFFLAVTVSVLLSIYINSRETVINPDGICYLMSAETYHQFGLHAAMNLCGQAKWPFYSMIIAYLAQVTQWTYSFSAYLLDGFFSAISVCMFLLIVKELGGSRRVLWFALSIILLSHEFNSVRQYIIRDHGFWAFYLISLFGLLRFVHLPNWRNAFIFNASLMIATLFRIEGLVFLFLLPLVIFCCQNYSIKQRSQFYFLLNLPILFLSGLITAWFFFSGQDFEKLSRIAEVFHQFHQGVFLMISQFQQTKTALIQSVLTTDATRDASLVLLLVLLTWYIIQVIGNLSWIYSLLVLYIWRGHRKIFKERTAQVLYAYLLVNLIVTFSFFSQHLFLSKRYLIALSLILMLWVPFALEKLWHNAHLRKNKIYFGIALIFILLSSLGGIFDFGYSKFYLNQAGNWLAVNIPVNTKLYVNDYQLMYYSKHFNKDLFAKLPIYTDANAITQNKWRQYDFLALRIGKHDAPEKIALLQSLPLTPLKMFANQRGDKVVIYQVKEIAK